MDNVQYSMGRRELVRVMDKRRSATGSEKRQIKRGYR